MELGRELQLERQDDGSQQSIQALRDAGKCPGGGIDIEARAVRSPCAARPGSKPWARLSMMCSRFINGATMIAPGMPVRITNTAVRAGFPWSFADMPIATAAGTDLGAIKATIMGEAPRKRAMSTVEISAVNLGWWKP